MKNLSIRWKLTLWYGFAVSVTLFAFGIILLILTRQQLLNRTDAALREELRELALEVEITPSEADFRLSTAKRFFHHDIYDFVVVHENGATVFLSSGLSDRDVARIQPCQVHGDDVGLRQVVYNVVENALKFTNNGGTVVIQCTTRQGTVVCEVVDTGVGITDEHLPHIFNRFYRVDSSRHSESGGAGLGLSIARMIVLAHGGTIEICSRPNTGTTVSICLPKMETLNCCPNGADERDLGEPSFATIKTELVAN